MGDKSAKPSVGARVARRLRRRVLVPPLAADLFDVMREIAAYSGRFVRIRLSSIGTNRVAARLNASAVSCGTP
jgi:hypothetical protein